MIRYGDDSPVPMRVKALRISGEKVRQWWNAQIEFDWGEDMFFPDDLKRPSVTMMVTPTGELLDCVVLDDGLDSEYLLEDAEKAILLAHVKFHLREWLANSSEEGERTI
jgi:hypothetical protein